MYNENQAACWRILGASGDIRASAGWLWAAHRLGLWRHAEAAGALLRLDLAAARAEAGGAHFPFRARVERLYWEAVGAALP